MENIFNAIETQWPESLWFLRPIFGLIGLTIMAIPILIFVWNKPTRNSVTSTVSEFIWDAVLPWSIVAVVVSFIVNYWDEALRFVDNLLF